MKRKNRVKNWIGFLKNQSIDIRVRMIYFLEVAVLIACLIGTACTILLRQPVSSMFPNIMLFILSFVGLYFSIVKRHYDVSMFVMVFGCANIAVPWMFFAAGGNASGMQLWLMFSLIVTVMMSMGKMRIFMVAVTLVEDLACICLGQYYPNLVTPMSGENAVFFDQLQSYAVVGVSLTIMLIIYISTYDNQRKLLEAQSIELRNLMQIDVLTGVFNRRAYYEAISDCMDKKQQKDMVLVSMDVNGLKKVNDLYGHSAGDEFICAAAKIIGEALGQYGRVFRTGGDEFMAILHCSEKEASGFEDKIKECIAREEAWADKMAIAIGIVCFNENADMDIVNIEKLADKRMYENKAAYYRNSGIDRRR